jgi:hypothetical protein
MFLEKRICFRDTKFAAKEVRSVKDMATSGLDGEGIPERNEREILPVCETLDEALNSLPFQRVFAQFQRKDPRFAEISLENIQQIASPDLTDVSTLLEANPSLPNAVRELYHFWQTHYLKWGELYRERGQQADLNRFERVNELIDEMLINAERNVQKVQTDYTLEPANKYLDVGAEFALELDTFKECDPIDFGDEVVNQKVRAIPVITNVHSLVRHLAMRTNSDKRQVAFKEFVPKDIPVLTEILDSIIPEDYVSLPIRVGVSTQLIVLNKKSFAEMIVSSSDQFYNIKNFHGVEFDTVIFHGVPYEAFEYGSGGKYIFPEGPKADGNAKRMFHSQPYYKTENSSGKTRFIGFVADQLATEEAQDDHKNIAPAYAGNRYHGYLKKPELQLSNDIAIEKGCLPVHGAAMRITLRNGRQMTVVIAGESSTGKSETIEQLRRNPMVQNIEVIADDMLHMKKVEGKWTAYACETGAFDNISNGDRLFEQDRLEATTVVYQSNKNARTVSKGVSDFAFDAKADEPIGFPVDALVYANNWDVTSEMKNALRSGEGTRHLDWVAELEPDASPQDVKLPFEIITDASRAFGVFHEGKRIKNEGTSAANAGDSIENMYGKTCVIDIHTPYGNPFVSEQLSERLREKWEECIGDFIENGRLVGQLRTMIGVSIQDPQTGRDQDKTQLARSGADALVDHIAHHGNPVFVQTVREAHGISDNEVREKAQELYDQQHPDKPTLSKEQSKIIWLEAERRLVDPAVRRWIAGVEGLEQRLFPEGNDTDSYQVLITEAESGVLHRISELQERDFANLAELYNVDPTSTDALSRVNEIFRRRLVFHLDQIMKGREV